MVLPESTHPIRMCLGCRQRGPRTQLIRVAVIGPGPDSPERTPELVIDHRKNLPGRGAWLHPTESCVTTAVRRRAFGPAFRLHGLTVRPDDLTEIFSEAGHEDSAGSQDR